MARVDINAVLETLAECAGIMPAAVAQWEESPTISRGHLTQILGPHQYDYSRPELEQFPTIQRQAMSKLLSLMDQTGAVVGRPRWASSSRPGCEGPIAACSENKFLQGVSRDFIAVESKQLLSIFGVRYIDDTHDEPGKPGFYLSTRRYSAAGKPAEIVEQASSRYELCSTLELLLSCMDGAAQAAKEAFASIDPTRGESLSLLTRWREFGQDESRTHEEVLEWLLEMRGTPRRPGKPLPRYSSDPVWPFLDRFCRKLGAARTKSPWVLRDGAKR